MKIAFDVHGVIQNFPEVFKPLMIALRSMGTAVAIISGPPEDYLREELSELGYIEGQHFDELYSIVDYLKAQPNVTMTQDARGRWWTDDTIWWATKSSICKINDICLLIDDSVQYREYFENGYKFILLTEQDLNKLMCTILNSVG